MLESPVKLKVLIFLKDSENLLDNSLKGYRTISRKDSYD